MGRTKRKKKRSKRGTGDPEENPFSILKEGPGKPSPHDAYLFDRREALVSPIETYWAEMRWALASARTPNDIRIAFGAISRNTNAPLLAPILRDGSERSTVESIRHLRRQLGNSVESERSLGDLFQASLRSFQDAERRAFTLSEEYRKRLKVELETRRKNIRELRIQITNQKGKLLRAQMQIQNKKELSGPVDKPDSATAESTIRTLQHDCEADEEVSNALMKQIGLITPKSATLAAEAAAHRKLLLDAAEQRLNDARHRTQELDRNLQDQEAFFFRTQILAFIKKARYALTPRTLANAISGLPYMTARRSAERCAQLESEVAMSRNQEALKFITSAWNRRNKRRHLSLVEWFEREIKRVPKFRIRAKRRIPNDFRAYLCEGWYFLKQAITETGRLRLDPRAMPDAITVRFLNSVSGTENPVESTRAEAARITD